MVCHRTVGTLGLVCHHLLFMVLEDLVGLDHFKDLHLVLMGQNLEVLILESCSRGQDLDLVTCSHIQELEGSDSVFLREARCNRLTSSTRPVTSTTSRTDQGFLDLEVLGPHLHRTVCRISCLEERIGQSLKLTVSLRMETLTGSLREARQTKKMENFLKQLQENGHQISRSGYRRHSTVRKAQRTRITWKVSLNRS